MKYLIFSDVHGNLPALEAVLSKEHDVSGYINLGDVVNYGPWSNECVELINTLDNTINILGNHEDYFNSGFCDVKNPLVRTFFQKTYPRFKYKNIISEYIKFTNFNSFLFIHTFNEKDYIFKDTNINLKSNTFLGHSHQQFIRFCNQYLLINPGSLGQNRNYINIANYVIWDFESGEIQLKSMPYNFNYFLSEMKRQNYPIDCVNYYLTKKQY